MKYKFIIETKHTKNSLDKTEPTLIDEFTADIFDLEESKARAKNIAISYIMDVKNEKTPGIVANNGYSIGIEEIP